MSDQENLHAYQVVMPRLGLTMTEGKILEWLVGEGARVEKGAPLFAIENEKSTLDIDAPASGILQIQVPAGTVVPILKPVALILSSEKVADYHQSAIEAPETRTIPEENRKPTAQQAAEKEVISGIKATPKARAEAKRLGVELGMITGTGLNGLISAEDVARAVREQIIRATPLARRVAEFRGISLKGITGSGSRGMITKADIENATLPPSKILEPTTGVSVPLPGLRGIIAERLSTGWRERPQVTLTTDADATSFAAARRNLNEELAQNPAGKRGKISLNALLVRLAAIALKEYSYMNVQLGADGIKVMPEINIGVAADSERGLLVPVVRDVDKKTLTEINTELGALIDRALSGKSLPDDLSGGTFTITNLGVYEIDAFSPIINPPECAILGVGRIAARPVGVNGEIVLRDMMTLSLSFDHRLVDGAPAARFLQRVKQLIERSYMLAFMS